MVSMNRWKKDLKGVEVSAGGRGGSAAHVNVVMVGEENNPFAKIGILISPESRGVRAGQMNFEKRFEADRGVENDDHQEKPHLQFTAIKAEYSEMFKILHVWGLRGCGGRNGQGEPMMAARSSGNQWRDSRGARGTTADNAKRVFSPYAQCKGSWNAPAAHKDDTRGVMLSVQAGGGWRNVGRGRCGSTESNGDMWRGRDRTRERRTSEGGEAAVAAGEQWWQKLRLVIRGTSCKHGCGRWAFKRSTFQRSALMDLPEKRHPEPAACLAYAASRLCRLLSLAVHTLAHPECCKAYYPPANIPYAVTVTKRRRFNTSPHPPRRPGALTGGERRRGRLPARLKHTSRRRRFALRDHSQAVTLPAPPQPPESGISTNQINALFPSARFPNFPAIPH
ncbi:hypothetical protein BD779DRAFT_1790749 [Infundibulicybe gibba]|nr:hypothetical protein BD779DRAFT_1790749 [Infundibulicybe gibba]